MMANHSTYIISHDCPDIRQRAETWVLVSCICIPITDRNIFCLLILSLFKTSRSIHLHVKSCLGKSETCVSMYLLMHLHCLQYDPHFMAEQKILG